MDRNPARAPQGRARIARGPIAAGLALLFGLAAAVASAHQGLLPDGMDARVLSFRIRDDKPMVEARVGAVAGRLMFDAGTPDAVFLNRDALVLPEGILVARGYAASGQEIEVRRHPAPEIRVAGERLAFGPELRSGDFGFTEPVLGEEFLGFLGLPALAGAAFLLDHERGRLTVLRIAADGAPVVGAPSPEEVVAELRVAPGAAGLPTAEGSLGSSPLAVEFDTGDGGTLYLGAERQASLEAEGGIERVGDRAFVHGVVLGGVAFDRIRVRLVRTGGPEDLRSGAEAATLRLGASFFRRWPTLWNLSAGTITVLRSGAGDAKGR